MSHIADPSSLPVGARVMFTAPFGNGSWQEYVQIKAEELQPIPDGVDDVTATAAVVGYLSAYLTLQQAGFAAGKSVLRACDPAALSATPPISLPRRSRVESGFNGWQQGEGRTGRVSAATITLSICPQSRSR